jgi:hypothetical protein
VPIQKLFLLNITGHAQGQPYLITPRKGLEPVGQFRALLPVVLMGEGLSPKAWSRLIERKTRLMNAGSSMKPQKAQVKDKGLGVESGDFGASKERFVTDEWGQRGSNRRPTD